MILRMPRSWFPWGKRLELKKGMKEMNKRLWALLTALALLLPGCGGGGGENRPEIRVGLALYKEDDTFIEAITEGIHRAAAESSREGTWRASISVADAEGSQISQNQQIERFLSLGYDVLCVNLVDRTNAAPIIDKAMEADIPIVFFNREPVPEDMEKWDRLCYVGSDARQSAELEAQIILDLWEREPQALDRNGDGVIQYIMMEGERRHQDTVIRTEGTIQALRDGGLELERLDSGIANWDRTQAQALMAGYLDQYGGQVELVICNNDDMALGGADAVEEANLDFHNIVGIDGTAAGATAVSQGKLLGTVAMQPEIHGRTVFRLAMELASGKTVSEMEELGPDRSVRVPMEILSRSNRKEEMKYETLIH